MTSIIEGIRAASNALGRSRAPHDVVEGMPFVSSANVEATFGKPAHRVMSTTVARNAAVQLGNGKAWPVNVVRDRGIALGVDTSGLPTAGRFVSLGDARQSKNFREFSDIDFRAEITKGRIPTIHVAPIDGGPPRLMVPEHILDLFAPMADAAVGGVAASNAVTKVRAPRQVASSTAPSSSVPLRKKAVTAPATAPAEAGTPAAGAKRVRRSDGDGDGAAVGGVAASKNALKPARASKQVVASSTAPSPSVPLRKKAVTAPATAPAEAGTPAAGAKRVRRSDGEPPASADASPEVAKEGPTAARAPKRKVTAPREGVSTPQQAGPVAPFEPAGTEQALSGGRRVGRRVKPEVLFVAGGGVVALGLLAVLPSGRDRTSSASKPVDPPTADPATAVIDDGAAPAPIDATPPADPAPAPEPAAPESAAPAPSPEEVAAAKRAELGAKIAATAAAELNTVAEFDDQGRITNRVAEYFPDSVPEPSNDWDWPGFFVAWAREQAGDPITPGPGWMMIKELRQHAVDTGTWGDRGVHQPQPGDVVFFTSPLQEHDETGKDAGIVRAVEGDTLHVVRGWVRGEGKETVAETQMSKNDPNIDGYAVVTP